MGIKRRLFILMLTFLMVVASAAIVFGRTEHEINNDIDKKTQELTEQEEKVNAMEEEMEAVKKDIDATQNEIRHLDAQIAQLQIQMDENQAKLKKKQEELDESVKALNARLRNMYKSGTLGFIDILFSSESLTDLIDNVTLVQHIFMSDQEIVDLLEKQQDEIEEIQVGLVEQQAAMDQKITEVNKKQKELADKYKSVAEEKGDAEEEIAALESDLHALQQESAASRNAVDMYGQYTGTSTGQFLWPVASGGTVSSEYGYRTCPVHGRELHAGIDIACGLGTDIVAADDGLVIQAGWNGGYGISVIISHGDNMFTLYGHNTRAKVYPGQTVKKGDVIALAGSTGNSTGPHCHFEVRIGSNDAAHTVNPRRYL